MINVDVAIIGTGPAGACAAIELAKSNLSVVIIEKEHLPRYKVCGGGLVFRGRQKLPIDIRGVIEKEFFGVDVLFNKNKMRFSGKRDVPVISMVMRDHFDNLLIEKAKQMGVSVLEDHKLLEMVFAGELIQLKTSQGDVYSRFVIAADGALSQTAKMAGWKETRMLIPAFEVEVEVLKDDFERLSEHARFDMDALPGGYGWCFPKKNHLSIGVASTQRTKINLRKYLKEYQELLGIKETIKQQTHGFQIPISYRTDGFVRNNVFLVGDAAGFADPLTLEGISNAIYSGQLAGRALLESEAEPQRAKELYEHWIYEKLIPELESSKRLSQFIYGNLYLRNLLLKVGGQYGYDLLMDVFIGNRAYPVITSKNLLKRFFRLVVGRRHL